MAGRRISPPIAIVAIGTLVAVAACGSGAAIAPTSAPTAAPAATATQAPPATPPASGPHKITAGSLPPGDYATSEFKPTLHFKLGSTWLGMFADDTDEIAFDRGNETGFFAMTRVSKVVDPTSHATISVPDDILAWLGAHPSFKWSGPSTTVEIAGLSAGVLDGHVNGMGSSETFAYATGNMRIQGGDHIRYYVLPLEGPDLTIILAASNEPDFEATLKAAQPTLDSLLIVTP